MTAQILKFPAPVPQEWERQKAADLIARGLEMMMSIAMSDNNQDLNALANQIRGRINYRPADFIHAQALLQIIREGSR